MHMGMWGVAVLFIVRPRGMDLQAAAPHGEEKKASTVGRLTEFG